MPIIIHREKGAHTPHGKRNRRNPTHSLQKRLHRRLQKRLRKRIPTSHRKGQTQSPPHRRTIPKNNLRMQNHQLPPRLRKQTNHKRRRRTPMLRLRKNHPPRRHTKLLQPTPIQPKLSTSAKSSHSTFSRKPNRSDCTINYMYNS